MIRRVSLSLAAVATLALAGCGSSSSPTGSVSASIGAHQLPGIKLPAYVPGPLNGFSTPRANALRRPLGVMIENYYPDSRPQAGLSQASTVIETLAEGGVTRFLALYLEGDATKVGPVRSTRIYFDTWASAFHAILAHVGGNDDAQAQLWHLPSVFNIDENRWEKSLYDTGTPLFWRSNDRQPPHNMYTSTYKLRSYAAANHQNWPYANASLLHKQPAPLSARGHSGTISIAFKEPLGGTVNPAYGVQYTFDRATDTYARVMGGTPHVDANSGKQLRPANVVVMITQNPVADSAAGITPESIQIPHLQSGSAYYFRDGHVVSGSWSQANQYAPLRFLDRHGKAIALNPGQTWIEVVPQGSAHSWSFR